MAGNDTEINLRFKVNDDGSIVLDKIGKSIQKVQDNTTQMNSSLGMIKLDSMINLAERAFQAGEKMYNLAKNTASAANDIQRNAQILNMSTADYQKWIYAAKMADVNSGDFSASMRLLTNSISQARQGTGDAAQAFRLLGIDLEDSSGKTKDQQTVLLETVDALNRYAEGTDRDTLMLSLFGRSWMTVKPLIDAGSDAIKKNKDELVKMGAVIDDAILGKGAQAEEQFKKLETQITAFKISLAGTALHLANFFKDTAQFARDAVEWMAKLANAAPKAPSPQAWAGEALTNTYAPWLGQKKPTYHPQALETRTAEELYNIGGPEAPPKKRETEAPRLVNAEAQLKSIRDENLQLLKDQESALKRMIDLQEKLNQSSNEAVEIANRLGIQTKAGTTQWIEKDIVGEYQKLLGSGLFSGEEMEQFKTRYTDALKNAMETAGGKNEFGRVTEFGQQIQDAISRISTMEVKDTPISKMRADFEKARQEVQYLEKWTGQISLDDSSIITAQDQIRQLRADLANLVNQDWSLTLSIYGYGSSELPIMEKIAEITNTFKTMGTEVGNIALKMDMSAITQNIATLQKNIVNAFNIPTLTLAGPAGKYVSQTREKDVAMWTAQIAAMEREREMLSAAGRYGAAQNMPVQGSSASPSVSGWGGEGGGAVTVNIGVINVNGENAAEIAEHLDAELADMYLRDGSKLKDAISGKM